MLKKWGPVISLSENSIFSELEVRHKMSDLKNCSEEVRAGRESMLQICTQDAYFCKSPAPCIFELFLHQKLDLSINAAIQVNIKVLCSACFGRGSKLVLVCAVCQGFGQRFQGVGGTSKGCVFCDERGYYLDTHDLCWKCCGKGFDFGTELLETKNVTQVLNPEDLAAINIKTHPNSTVSVLLFKSKGDSKYRCARGDVLVVVHQRLSHEELLNATD